jgi:CheY-like chemotaxis protein
VRKFRETPSLASTVFIAYAGFTEDGEPNMARAAGFDHVLTKPGRPQELLEILETCARSDRS